MKTENSENGENGGNVTEPDTSAENGENVAEPDTSKWRITYWLNEINFNTLIYVLRFFCLWFLPVIIDNLYQGVKEEESQLCFSVS